MISPEKVQEYKNNVLEAFAEAGLIFTKEEINNPGKFQLIEYYDRFEEVGIAMLTVTNEPRYCGRFLYFFPGQSCIEHWHPQVDGKPGKEETFRVLKGTIYAYEEGPETLRIKAAIPKGLERFYIVKNETVLNAGDQIVLGKEAKHWFQAGLEGAVCVEFSTQAIDDRDRGNDPDCRIAIY